MQNELRDRIAANIRSRTEEKGISLNKLADFAGLSRRQLFNFLSGERDITIGWLEKIALALDCDVHDLTGP